MSDATLHYDGRDMTFYDCDPADCIEAGLLRGEWYELPMLELIRDLDVRGNYLDIGAYVGTFTLFAGLFCPACKVFSVEPQIDIYGKLTSNIEANGLDRGGALWTALADHFRWGSMTLFPSNRGGSHIAEGHDVPVITLDSLKLPNIKLAKIDVENGELAVLRGGMNTLASVDHLFIEVWPQGTCLKYGLPYTDGEVTDLLSGMGFVHKLDLPGDNEWWRKE
jgi:FkbM family methyltransferase